MLHLPGGRYFNEERERFSLCPQNWHPQHPALHLDLNNHINVNDNSHISCFQLSRQINCNQPIERWVKAATRGMDRNTWRMSVAAPRVTGISACSGFSTQ